MKLLSQAVPIGALLLGLIVPAQAAGGLTFNGSAAFSGPGNAFIRLTPSAPSQAGSVWLTSKRPVNLGFRTSFFFRIRNPGGIEGADGFAFVIQNDSTAALGAAGGGIGYDGIPKSIAVEFDTFQNGWGGVSDPDNNHISIHTNGVGANSADEAFSLGSTSAIPNISDGAVHFVRIGSFLGTMTVELDGVIVLTVPVSLTPALDASAKAYFGFTAATGAGYEEHDIDGLCVATF